MSRRRSYRPESEEEEPEAEVAEKDQALELEEAGALGGFVVVPDEPTAPQSPAVVVAPGSGFCPHCSAASGQPVKVTPDRKGVHTCAQCRAEKVA